jgi:hypothetical protein
MTRDGRLSKAAAYNYKVTRHRGTEAQSLKP